MTYCPNGSGKKKTILITLGLLNTDAELKKGSERCVYIQCGFLLRTEPSGFQSCTCVFNYTCAIPYQRCRTFFLDDLFKAMVLCLFFHGVIHVLGVWLAEEVLKVWASPCIPLAVTFYIYILKWQSWIWMARAVASISADSAHNLF